MNYAVSVTGLFHKVVDRTTACGQYLDEAPELRLTDGDWLAEHPWDLCRKCKEATEPAWHDMRTAAEREAGS